MSNREIMLVLIAICLGVAMFMQRSCNNLERDKLVESLATYSDSAEFYKLKVNGQKVDIAFNQSLMLENKRQLENMLAKYDTLSKMVSKFKQVQSVTVVQGGALITGDTVYLPRPIPCNFQPFRFHKDSSHYKLRATIHPSFITIDSLAIPNTQSIVIGSRKMGLFKRPEMRVEIINSNPLMQTTNIGSFVVQNQRKWYQRGWIKVGAGLVAGAYITHRISR